MPGVRGKVEPGILDTESQVVECEGGKGGDAFGLKKKISCQLPQGEVWAVDFEEEESDIEEISEDEAVLRKELKWTTWQHTVANLWGSHNSAFIAGSQNISNTKSVFSAAAAMESTVQSAKTEAAQVLMEARKIEEAYEAAGQRDDPDLLEMSKEVDRLGDLGVELHELWNSRKREMGCDQRRQIESLLNAVDTVDTLGTGEHW